MPSGSLSESGLVPVSISIAIATPIPIPTPMVGEVQSLFSEQLLMRYGAPGDA